MSITPLTVLYLHFRVYLASECVLAVSSGLDVKTSFSICGPHEWTVPFKEAAG